MVELVEQLNAPIANAYQLIANHLPLGDAHRGRLRIDEHLQLQQAAALDGEGDVIAVDDGHQVAVLVAVLQLNLIRRRELEEAHHHDQQLIVGDLLIVDWHLANDVAVLRLDDNLAGQIGKVGEFALVHRREGGRRVGGCHQGPGGRIDV